MFGTAPAEVRLCSRAKACEKCYSLYEVVKRLGGKIVKIVCYDCGHEKPIIQSNNSVIEL